MTGINYIEKRFHAVESMCVTGLPSENQQVVKIVRCLKDNLYQVINPAGEKYLVSTVKWFRSIIWAAKGDFVLIEPILGGKRVKGNIVKVMNNISILYFKNNNLWPAQFGDKGYLARKLK